MWAGGVDGVGFGCVVRVGYHVESARDGYFRPCHLVEDRDPLFTLVDALELLEHRVDDFHACLAIFSGVL